MVLLTSKKDGPNSVVGSARGALPSSVTAMTSTAANLLHRDVISLAGVMAGSDGARQAREVFNYGDMLFHEGQRDLIARQRAHEAAAEVEDPECTFKPKISELAESFGDRGHMGDRAAALEQQKREKMQDLENAVRATEDRELTFKPRIQNRKTLALTSGRNPDFLEEMAQKDAEKRARMQALRAAVEQEQRKGETHRPRVRGDGRPSSARGVGSRLHAQKTKAFASSIGPPASSDPECTFHPNASGLGKSGSTPLFGATPRALPTEQLEAVGDALYKDAHNRQLRRQMMQEQLTDELQRARDDPKISAKSAQLAFNKFQRDVHRCAHALPSAHEAHRRTPTPPPPI